MVYVYFSKFFHPKSYYSLDFSKGKYWLAMLLSGLPLITTIQAAEPADFGSYGGDHTNKTVQIHNNDNNNHNANKYNKQDWSVLNEVYNDLEDLADSKENDDISKAIKLANKNQNLAKFVMSFKKKINKKIEEKQEEIEKLASIINQQKEEITQFEQKIRYQKEAINDYQHELDSYKLTNQNLKKDAIDYLKQINDLNENLQTITLSSNNKTSDNSSQSESSLSKQYNNLNKTYIKLENTYNELALNYKTALNKLENQKDYDTLKENIINLKNIIKNLELTIGNNNNTIKDKNKEISDLTNEVSKQYNELVEQDEIINNQNYILNLPKNLSGNFNNNSEDDLDNNLASQFAQPQTSINDNNNSTFGPPSPRRQKSHIMQPVSRSNNNDDTDIYFHDTSEEDFDSQARKRDRREDYEYSLEFRKYRSVAIDLLVAKIQEGNPTKDEERLNNYISIYIQEFSKAYQTFKDFSYDETLDLINNDYYYYTARGKDHEITYLMVPLLNKFLADYSKKLGSNMSNTPEKNVKLLAAQDFYIAIFSRIYNKVWAQKDIAPIINYNNNDYNDSSFTLNEKELLQKSKEEAGNIATKIQKEVSNTVQQKRDAEKEAKKALLQKQQEKDLIKQKETELQKEKELRKKEQENLRRKIEKLNLNKEKKDSNELKNELLLAQNTLKLKNKEADLLDKNLKALNTQQVQLTKDKEDLEKRYNEMKKLNLEVAELKKKVKIDKEQLNKLKKELDNSKEEHRKKLNKLLEEKSLLIQQLEEKNLLVQQSSNNQFTAQNYEILILVEFKNWFIKDSRVVKFLAPGYLTLKQAIDATEQQRLNTEIVEIAIQSPSNKTNKMHAIPVKDRNKYNTTSLQTLAATMPAEPTTIFKMSHWQILLYLIFGFGIGSFVTQFIVLSISLLVKGVRNFLHTSSSKTVKKKNQVQSKSLNVII